MNTYIALFRGINVGGRHMLPMKELKAALEKTGCVEVRTYIQSGNVVFRTAMSDAALLAKRLATTISKRHGFEPRIFLLTRGELETIVAGNPFRQADENPKSVHVFFLAELPNKPDLKSLEAIKTQNERFELKGRIFYLYTPDGFGVSKLAARAERLLGVQGTARNWRTVTTLLEMTKVSH